MNDDVIQNKAVYTLSEFTLHYLDSFGGIIK